jgi:chromosome partitioning protein
LADLDPQAHFTCDLGIPAQDLDKTIYGLLRGEAKLPDALHDRDGLTVLPANLSLSGAESKFGGTAGRELLLKESLKGLSGFDFLLIDCSPSTPCLQQGKSSFPSRQSFWPCRA